MTPFDHLIVVILMIIAPLAGYISFQRVRRRIAAGEKVGRYEIYNSTLASHWTLFVVFVTAWTYMGRPWSDLGLSSQVDANFVTGLLLTIAAVAGLVFQLVKVRRASAEEIKKYRDSVEKIEMIMPRNGNELTRFYGLSITAGIVEEILWRGFLFWYLGFFMPLWAAALLSTIGFALGHAYQGMRQVPAIFLVGAVFSGLYLLTGTIWLSILLHALVDILQGRIAYEIMQRTELANNDAGNVASTV